MVTRIMALMAFLMVHCELLQAQWVQLGPVEGFGTLATDSNGLYLYAHVGSGTIRSSDLGQSWQPLGIDGAYVFFNSAEIVAGTQRGMIFKSTDYGAHWDSISNSMAHTGITAMCRANGELFAGTQGYGLFHSSDTGRSWVPINTGLPMSDSFIYWSVSAMTAKDGYLFVGTYGGLEPGAGIFRTKLDTIKWTNVDPNFEGGNVYSFTNIGTILFAAGYYFDGGQGSIHRTSDDGSSWVNIAQSANPEAVSLCYSFPYLISGYHGSGVFISTDSGNLWIPSTAGMPISTITDYKYEDVDGLAVERGYVFAGISGDSNGLWRRPVSDLAGVQQVNAAQPEIQSFPNPFSQSTEITFTSEAVGYADVSIVNLLGMEVAHLFSGELAAGEHSFVWSKPAGLPDGMYECLVRMNGRVETMPVVLLH